GHRSPRRRATLLAHVSAAMYTHWFARSMQPAPHDDEDAPDIVSAVRAAHAASELFDRGWTALDVDRAGLVAAVRNAPRPPPPSVTVTGARWRRSTTPTSLGRRRRSSPATSCW